MLLALLACSRPPPSGPPDVVLVSLDTVRYDALSCDGGPPGATPTLDALAARGLRFARAYAHAPTTLNSHASVFTGLDPHEHRVPRNGFPLDPALPTLAERFAAAGYDTIGIAGASVLDPDTGITRGFRVWDADFTANHRFRREETTADLVTDRALARVQEREPGKPLFLFVHYFDAHAPYDAPEPWTRKFADPDYAGTFDGSRAEMERVTRAVRLAAFDPRDVAEVRARYQGEVAFVDHELGRLLDGLALPEPVVAAFGDHGEGLGDERLNPFGHGGDVDAWAIHVPLVVADRGVRGGPAIEDLARLSDLGTTLLGLAGLAAPLGRGRDLLGHPAPTPHFAEATQPIPHARRDAWPNLAFERAVLDGDWYLVRHPAGLEQLYDQRPTLHMALDVAAQARLDGLLDAWDAAAPGPVERELSPEKAEALRALGYTE